MCVGSSHIQLTFYPSHSQLQGDSSRYSKPPVDFKTNVPFWPGLAWPGHSGTFVLKSTGGFKQRDVSPCIRMLKMLPPPPRPSLTGGARARWPSGKRSSRARFIVGRAALVKCYSISETWYKKSKASPVFLTKSSLKRAPSWLTSTHAWRRRRGTCQRPSPRTI